MPTLVPCGHPLCALAGDGCSLEIGLSRGCRTGPRDAAPFERALIDEVATLLGQLPAPEAAKRLAFLYRREARNDRNLLGIADDLDAEPADQLAALLRRA